MNKICMDKNVYDVILFRLFCLSESTSNIFLFLNFDFSKGIKIIPKR